MKKIFDLKHEQKKIPFNFRVAWFFSCLAFTLLFHGAISAQTTPPAHSIGRVSLEGQTTNFTTTKDVKNFIAIESMKSLPDDYNVPGYIASGQKVEDVCKELEKRYPEFYGRSDAQLIEAVNSDTARFIRMLDEDKAIRKHFNLNR